MRQSRLFPAVLVPIMVIVLFVVSHLSASVTFWDAFDSTANGNYNSLNHRKNNYTISISDLDEFNIYKILWNNDSVQLHWKSKDIHAHVLFHDKLMSKTFLFMPDELLTRKIISEALNPGQTSEWHSDIRPASEPADNIVFTNGADYIKAMRTPAPGSLLLVALGLLSLRITRRLRY